MRKGWKQKGKAVFLGILAALLAGGAFAPLSAQAGGIYHTGGNGKNGGADQETFTYDEEKLYQGLKSAASRIAAGKRSSAKVTVQNFSNLWNSQWEINEMMGRIMDRLLEETPGDFYWYDSGAGVYSTWTYADNGKILTMTMTLSVLPEYQGYDSTMTDTAKTAAAKPAVDKAWAIVNRNRNQTDYRKLKAYLTEICRLASLDTEGEQEGPVSYEDPWPMIWVFDGDAKTSGGAEGYAKAFQYLCDLSEFENAGCYTTQGATSAGIGVDGHMWNIVSLDGSSYLVDGANCDTGAVGAPDRLFLAGGEGSVRNGYTFPLSQDGESITYQYDVNQWGLLGNVLNLSPYSYLDPATLELKITPPKAEETVFGDPVDSRILSGGSAADSKGREVPGSFAWAEETVSYGDAGTKVLQAVFLPENSQYETKEVPVSVKVNRRPVTVTADSQSKVFGEPDPELTYGYANVIAGCPLKGSLAREPGEDVGTYSILAGDLTDANNPNYAITFTESSLEISLGDYTEQVSSSQSIWPGTGTFTEPVFTGADGKKIPGTLTYSYGGRKDQTYAEIKEVLAKLPTNTKGTLTYTFVPEKNYASKSGSIDFSVRTLEFTVGNARASASNAVTVKQNAAYGDSWDEIVKIGSITAKSGTGSDSDSRHFKLRESGKAEVGNGQSFQVLYSGTIDGRTYTDEVVCSGTVDVKKRVVTVSAGSYKVSKTYDKTRNGGTVSGKLAMSNVLSADADRLNVTGTPEGYTSPNVNGQSRMAVKLSLSGSAASNYELGSDTVDVPCEITPKTIRPTVKASGSYSYTGYAIAPTLSVSDGSDVLSSSDYQMTLSDNTDVGTARVTVRPKTGGNYTWSEPVETEFSIHKGEYKGMKTGFFSAGTGEIAELEISDLLPEGYKLGNIRAEDKDHILDGIPWVSDGVLSCKLSGDAAKTGRTATVILPVEETDNYRSFELTFTVAMVFPQVGAEDDPEAPSPGGETKEPDTSGPSGPSSQIPDTLAPGGADATTVAAQTVKSERPGISPWIAIGWVILGAALGVGVFGSIYYVKSKEEEEEAEETEEE